MTQHPQPSAEALKPCPFCGKQPTSRWFDCSTPGMEDCGYWGIDCCCAHVHDDSEEEAAAKWNRRAALAAPGEVVPDNIHDAYRKGWMDREADLLTGIERVYGATPAPSTPAEVVNWEGMLRKEEQSHTNTIKQRDWAEETINAMYQAVIGHPPEWSNLFTYDDAVREVEEATLPDSTATPAPGGGGDAEDVAILNGIGEALESRGYANMTNGRDIGALLDELEALRAHPPGGAQSGGNAIDARSWRLGMERAEKIARSCRVKTEGGRSRVRYDVAMEIAQEITNQMATPPAAEVQR